MSHPAQPEPATKDKLISARNWILWGVLLLATFSILISVIYPKTENGVVAPQFASSKAAEVPDVVARAWYPSSRVVQDREFAVEFELENRSDVEVRDVVITDLPTGFAFTVLSWSKWEGEQLQRLDDMKWPRMDVLGKHNSARYQCKLVPRVASGSYALMAVYAFSAQGVRAHSAVAIGPFQVSTSWWREELRNVLTAIQTVLATLILPISLGVLAWYLPHLASNRDARERQLAETRAQEEQTWNLLLPYSLQASQKYYLPACSATAGLLYLHRQWDIDKKSEERRHEVMHALMMFLRHIRAARDELGGLHFKDRKGEEAAARCWIIAARVASQPFYTSNEGCRSGRS